MLEDFLQKQEIDIILPKEIKRPVFDDIRGFAAYTNIGSMGQGDGDDETRPYSAY